MALVTVRMFGGTAFEVAPGLGYFLVPTVPPQHGHYDYNDPACCPVDTGPLPRTCQHCRDGVGLVTFHAIGTD